MKHVPRVPKVELTPGLKAWVEHRRNLRGFDPWSYIDAKRALLAKYFKQQEIKVVLVAVSGGIDSAVVLGLLSGIKSVTTIAVTLPARDEVGATRQNETVRLALHLEDKFGVKIHVLNLHDSINNIQQEITNSTGLASTNWARGQSVAYTRTAVLYSMTAALGDQARTVLVGTTNKDEGSYLGYIGKASDGMVDIQPISDLHKSEVYQVANVLGVPIEIIKAVPTGDMFDGRTDEEVFGAPYDFVELYTDLKHEYGSTDARLWSYAGADDLQVTLTKADIEQFDLYAEACEQLHMYNRHKYIGSSPAVHFDLMPFELNDGWLTNCRKPPVQAEAPKVPYIEAVMPLTKINRNAYSFHQSRTTISGSIYTFKSFFDEFAVKSLRRQIEIEGEWLPADKHGKLISRTHQSSVCSWRKNVMCPSMARFVKKQTDSVFAQLYNPQNDLSAGSAVWSKSRINPFFRAIKYDGAGMLVPHYDDAYRGYPGEVSFMSVLIYLTSGTTRFLKETRTFHEFRDQTEAPTPDMVWIEYHMEPGDMLIFDHRMLHDSGPVHDEKLVLRSDYLYMKPQLGRALK